MTSWPLLITTICCCEKYPMLNPCSNQPEIIPKYIGLKSDFLCRTTAEQWHFLTWLQVGKVTPLRIPGIMTRKNVERDPAHMLVSMQFRVIMSRSPNPIPNYPFQLQFLTGLVVQMSNMANIPSLKCEKLR